MKNVDLWDLKREFLEYCELDKGQSSLTISGYDRYLTRFFSWLEQYKNQVVSSKKYAVCEENSTPKRQENINNNLTIKQSGDFNNQKPSAISNKQLAVLSPENIDQEAIRQYRLYVNRLKDRKNQELKQTTQNYHILAVRAFLRYLSFRGIKTLSPEKVSIARTGDREITFLQSEELESILSSPNTKSLPGLRDRAILEVLFSTGMRVSELHALNYDDINFERGEIAVLGKGKKLRVVFLSKSALNWLQQYLQNLGFVKEENGSLSQNNEMPVFVSKKNTRLSVRTIERIVQKYAGKAGILKKVSPHTFRHSFATDLLSAGADVRSVQSLLGHSSITTTQIYTHVTDQHLREIHQAFHGRLHEEDTKKDPEGLQ